jgi:hypothetical protein
VTVGTLGERITVDSSRRRYGSGEPRDRRSLWAAVNAIFAIAFLPAATIYLIGYRHLLTACFSRVMSTTAAS